MKQGSSEEKTLLVGLRRGDAAAYTRLVDTYGGKVQSLARRYARSEADAEDITQETLIEICRSIHSFRQEASLSTFIYRIAMNRCLKYRERQQRTVQNTVSLDNLDFLSNEMGDPVQQAVRAELACEVRSALDTLNDGHREVVILHEMHGLTYSECASVLNVPVGTVKSRLFHAFLRLRERLGKYVRSEESRPVDLPGNERGEEEIAAPRVMLEKGGAK